MFFPVFWRRPTPPVNMMLGNRKGGGAKGSVRFWGGGTYHRAPPKLACGCLRKWDSSGLCPFPLKSMTRREQGGGESYTIGEGDPKLFLGRGLIWYVFPSPEFSTPFAFKLVAFQTQTQNRSVLATQFPKSHPCPLW